MEISAVPARTEIGPRALGWDPRNRESLWATGVRVVLLGSGVKSMKCASSRR